MKIVGAVLMWMVVIDVAGVLACLFFEIPPLRRSSSLLPYAIWFVLGVFCGILSYHSAGSFVSKEGDVDWMEKKGAGRAGKFILSVTAVLLALLCALFYVLWWRHPMVGDLFVPDSAGTTLTFFASILLAMALMRLLFAEETDKKLVQDDRNA